MSDVIIPRQKKAITDVLISGNGKPWIDLYPDYVLFGEQEKQTLKPPENRMCMFCKEAPAIVSRHKMTNSGTGQHAGYRYCDKCDKNIHF